LALALMDDEDKSLPPECKRPGYLDGYGLLKRETECQRGIETKRLKCAANDEYREKVLFNTEDKMR